MIDQCLICGNSENWIVLNTYNKPDKYEHAVGIENVQRSWVKCVKCGFCFQTRNYDESKLNSIYKKTYRSKAFRGETIDHAFDRITNIKNNENEKRYIWFATHTKYEEHKNVLDIGSGIGVWPHVLKTADYYVDCVEENELSVDFIYEKLGLRCFKGLKNVNEKYDTITLIHVLEHIKSPTYFLNDLKEYLRPNGILFIEVPDSSEFLYLEKEHDEFNSCHLYFYNMSSLAKILEYSGFTPIEMHVERTIQRGLTRVMCLAIN